MKKLVYGLVGLALLTSTALAKDLEIFVKRNNGLIQVANKEALKKNYEGDVFFNYRKGKDTWILDRITWYRQYSKREFVRCITKEDVPTYVDGIYSLYYDQDQDEESLVANFYDNVDSKVKDAWIEIAKKHVKELNES